MQQSWDFASKMCFKCRFLTATECPRAPAEALTMHGSMSLLYFKQGVSTFQK